MLAFMAISAGRTRRRQAPENRGYFTKMRRSPCTPGGREHKSVAMTLVSKERAILFADVSGSTALYEKLGDKPAARAIEACLGELRAIVAKWEGKVVKTIGDELMVVFGRPEVACAAARLAVLAKGGYIITSAATVKTLSDTQRINLRDLDTIPVKGKQEAVRVFELMWGDTEDATQLAGLASSARIEARLTLEIGERTVDFPREKAALTLGRDATCDVVVGEKTASRNHARIERSGVQFVLIDESTNGTYVEIEGDREVLLRRDRIMLRGRGKIAFGTSTGAAAELLLFDCS